MFNSVFSATLRMLLNTFNWLCNNSTSVKLYIIVSTHGWQTNLNKTSIVASVNKKKLKKLKKHSIRTLLVWVLLKGFQNTCLSVGERILGG